jgi:SAM-dependent methyltransferase
METVRYDIAAEESARQGWYLANRDRLVEWLARRALAGLDGKRVLDVGCGTGGVGSRLAKRGASVMGVDQDLKSLEQAKKTGRLKEVRQADVTALPFADNDFDLAIASEVLEHVDDDRKGLSELCRVARRAVVVTMPAHMSLWTYSDDLLLHKRRYAKAEFTDVLKTSGWKLQGYGAFGMLPATAISAFKAMGRDKEPSAEGNMPLASRYAIPGWMDRTLEAAFMVECSLASHRLIPWGAHWWAILQRP